MFEWLSQQSAGQLIGLTAVVMGPLIAISAVIAGAWARVRRAEVLARVAESDAVLKQQMIERGMSADEIVRVLEAGQKPGGKLAREEERALLCKR
jgi:hypothetical protein